MYAFPGPEPLKVGAPTTATLPDTAAEYPK